MFCAVNGKVKPRIDFKNGKNVIASLVLSKLKKRKCYFKNSFLLDYETKVLHLRLMVFISPDITIIYE